MRTPALLACLLAVACSTHRGSDTRVGTDAGATDGAVAGTDGKPPADMDCRVRDAAPPHPLPDAAPPPPDAAPPPPDASPLSVCDRACDRAADCAVDVCAGFDWTTAPGVTDACYRHCDGAFETQVLAAADCGAVSDLLLASVGRYDQACERNPCREACDRLGRCVVEVCAGFDPPTDRQIADDCASGCQPQDADWLLGADSCETIIDAITQGDPTFGRECHGDEPADCPPADLCDAYAEKAAGCLIAHCDGHADPYLEGLRAAFSLFCQFDPNCLTADVARGLLDEGLGCDDAAFADLGPADPFAAICRGEVGAPPGEVREACEALMRCPGSEGFVSVDVCMVYLGLRDDASQRVECLRAAGDCQRSIECLEDW